ncbi:MAG: hypothetical protein IJ760_05035 [Bacteroidales bacterium]|nr:hypothetical protein [Bacteroidales bacterium]
MTHRVTGISKRHVRRQLRLPFFCIVLSAVVAAGCGGGGKNVAFERFEQLLFTTPPQSLRDVLRQNRARFSTPLLNVAPDNAAYMESVAAFVSDPVLQYVYHVTDSLYSDLGDVERGLGRAMARAEKLCPSMRYSSFFTLITGDFDDYQNRVFCDQSTLCVSIDRYATPWLERYQSFGVPLYQQRLLRREYIVPDCMAAVARAHIAMPDGDMTLLDYAVAEGKTLYFMKRVLPGTPDTLLLRYSREQLRWMRDNTAGVWGWMIQNRVLFSTDLGLFRNLVDEAPKTNTFGDGSAPRTAAYIGLQIVEAYMKNSRATVEQLFAETDSRLILEQSGWRP